MDVIRLPGRSYKNKRHVHTLKNNIRTQRQWRTKVPFCNMNRVIALKNAVFASTITRITYSCVPRKSPTRVYTRTVYRVKHVVYRGHRATGRGGRVNVPAMIYRAKVAIYDARVYASGTRTGAKYERAYLILITLNMQIEFEYAHRNVWVFAENDVISVGAL